MEQPSRNQILMRRYLMGELSEQECDDLEDKYFNDDELFGELLDAEDQIVDDYRLSQLSPGERELFERRFLTQPERRREIKLAVLFAQYLDERRASNLSLPNAEPDARSRSGPLFAWLRALRPIPGWTLAAATLIVALGVGWIVMNTSQPKVQPLSNPAKQDDQAGRALKDRARIEEELASLQTRPTHAKDAISFTLTRGASRGSEEIKKITPGPETTLIIFTLDAGAENYAGYQASLQKAYDESAGILIKRLEVKKTAAGKNVMVRLPAEMLETDDYQIKLEGIGAQGDVYTIGKYLFQVRRQ